ncbi:late competence protein [Gracilibacillus boraciitolerans JCM 21714]|uniref:ComG operon protein 3 n=1 Tax=Gracilibacillus boraciitolerans JCM 21714 TaxID=1298598 RepID=W4VEH8_9BACI|nr:competence type IV pilus major pilin ComGC [Gracilibacillus boraciitolerans]GAE91218.1 late competence protein [Gracilibacillus boraciitolerans JCM 21714]
MKNQKGFTLIEMLIVLAVISILLILIVPNLADKSDTIQDKGCEALLQMVENQVIAYEIDNGEKPDDLTVLEGDYVDSLTCDNDTRIVSVITAEPYKLGLTDN